MEGCGRIWWRFSEFCSFYFSLHNHTCSSFMALCLFLSLFSHLLYIIILVFIIPFFTISQLATSTFQAVLITNGSSSYTVFTYECGEMEWGGATIGWAYSNSVYQRHSLSKSIYSDDIGCRYSSSSSIIVYKLGKFLTVPNLFLH